MLPNPSPRELRFRAPADAATSVLPRGKSRAFWAAILPWHRRDLAAIGRRLLLLLPALLFVPVVLAPPLNHDVAAVLQFSQRWFNGEHLYSDLIDVNPPLIFVLNLIPVALDWLTPLDAIQSLQLCLFVFGGFAWWLSIAVRDRAAEGPTTRALLDVMPGLFLFTAGYDFGQREHILAIGALPYLLSAATRSRDGRLRHPIATGLLAGLVFALKPYFLAIPLLVEAGVLLGRVGRRPDLHGLRQVAARSLRDPILWLMAAVWAVYLASLPLIFPDYLTVVVPLVRDYYLDLGGASVLGLLLERHLATTLCLLAPLLWIVARRPLAGGMGLPRALALAALGALASALAQHKGWSYHILPVQLFTLALATVLAANWIDRSGAARTAPGPSGIAACLAGLIALYAIGAGEAPWKQIDYGRSPLAGLVALLKQEAAGERVLVLSPGIYPIFPALNYADARLTLRTMNMWLLEGAYERCLPSGKRYREVWEMGRPEFFVFRTVAEDFARTPPSVVVVDRQPGIPWCGSEFNFIDYFSRHPLFAEVWSHYRLTSEWDRYRVYTRKD